MFESNSGIQKWTSGIRNSQEGIRNSITSWITLYETIYSNRIYATSLNFQITSLIPGHWVDHGSNIVS